MFRRSLSFAALAALACTALPASAGEVEVVLPAHPQARAQHEEFGYAEAVVHGDTVYLSGIVGGKLGADTEEEAYDRAFRHIAAALKRAGSSMADVLDMTTYHTDLPAQIDVFSAVKRRHMGAHFPAWTAIDVDRLLPDEGLVEIKVIARRTPSAGS